MGDGERLRQKCERSSETPTSLLLGGAGQQIKYLKQHKVSACYAVRCDCSKERCEKRRGRGLAMCGLFRSRCNALEPNLHRLRTRRETSSRVSAVRLSAARNHDSPNLAPADMRATFGATCSADFACDT